MSEESSKGRRKKLVKQSLKGLISTHKSYLECLDLGIINTKSNVSILKEAALNTRKGAEFDITCDVNTN